MHFKHIYINKSDWVPRQYLDDGRSRYVHVKNEAYLAWIADGNVPEVIPWEEPPMNIIVEDPWESIRSSRNALLRESDWTQLSDVALNKATVKLWQAYRQALRDITLQPDPKNIVWPELPQ